MSVNIGDLVLEIAGSNNGAYRTQGEGAKYFVRHAVDGISVVPYDSFVFSSGRCSICSEECMLYKTGGDVLLGYFDKEPMCIHSSDEEAVYTSSDNFIGFIGKEGKARFGCVDFAYSDIIDFGYGLDAVSFSDEDAFEFTENSALGVCNGSVGSFDKLALYACRGGTVYLKGCDSITEVKVENDTFVVDRYAVLYWTGDFSLMRSGDLIKFDGNG